MEPQAPARPIFFALVFCCCALLASIPLISCTPPQSSEFSWESLPGPFARNLSTVFPMSAGSGVLAGLENGEIAYSPDRGKSWAYRTPASKGGTVFRFVAAPERPSTVYAATAHGLFLSTDTARTWRRVVVADSADTATSVRTLAFDPWKPELCYAGTGGHGIFRSTDGGSTWHSVFEAGDSLLRTATVLDLIVDPRHPDRLAAAIGVQGTATSTDAGRTWQLSARSAATIGANTTHVMLHKDNSDLLLVGNDAGGIFRSTSFGTHWSPVRPASAGDKILSFWSDPSRPQSVLAGTENGVIQSRDFGESWQAWEGTLPPFSSTLVLSPPPSEQMYAFGSSIGLRVSSDRGMTWQSAASHLGGATASVLSFGPDGNTVFAAVGNALLRYHPDSSDWQPLGRGLTGGTIFSLSIDPRDDSCLYTTTVSGAFRSTDGGANWAPFARPLPMTPHLLVAHPWFPTRLLASGKQGIFVSTDRGKTWRESRPIGKNPPVHSFTFRQTDAGAIFAAASPAAVLFTHDGGITWESTRYGLGSDTLTFLSLDDQDPQVCYVWTTNGRCYRSLNGGLEWSRFSPPWNTDDHVLFASDPGNASQLVALVNGRMVYLTTNGGTLWNRILDRRLPAEPVSVAWHAHRGTLIVGTRDRGVYRLVLPEALREDPGQNAQ